MVQVHVDSPTGGLTALAGDAVIGLELVGRVFLRLPLRVRPLLSLDQRDDGPTLIDVLLCDEANVTHTRWDVALYTRVRTFDAEAHERTPQEVTHLRDGMRGVLESNEKPTARAPQEELERVVLLIAGR